MKTLKLKQFILEQKPKVIPLDNHIHLKIYSDSQDIDVRVYYSNEEDQIGYAIFDRDGNNLTAKDIAIDSPHRGRGIGKKIYDTLKRDGFKIYKSNDLLPDGERFWKRWRGDKTVW